ncbi:MAG: type II restriction enzyme [Deltaproteobacteria bacterium]
MKPENLRPSDVAWQAIFDRYKIGEHNFEREQFPLTAEQIKDATRQFKTTGQREARILCKQDTRESRPSVFQKNGLFILPVKNGNYIIVKGEGYVDLPVITEITQIYFSKLGFKPATSAIGNSEMQYLDFAYAASLIRTFMDDDSLALTIRGRKYTPRFSFSVGSQSITVESVQTEVDAGYEGENQVVLVEAKGGGASNTIIRQLYYPLRQWTEHLRRASIQKSVSTIFFEKQGGEYLLWQFRFSEESDYNSIELVRSGKFEIL